MDDKKALEALGRGEHQDQTTLKRLLQRDLIRASDVTNLQSTERELLFIDITQKGKELLERA